MSLCQGTLNIAEYTVKFKELCKFSTIYQRNSDEQWKCVKYEEGLREEILVSVGPMEICDYATLVNKCCLVEDSNRKLAVARLKLTRRSWRRKGRSSSPNPRRSCFKVEASKVSNPRSLLRNHRSLQMVRLAPSVANFMEDALA